jgi:hypothetical protein
MPGKNEYLKHKYGLFVHYVYGDAYPVTQNVGGSIPKNLNELAEGFDVEAFVRDVVSFGMEYVIFTTWHCSMNMLYPSEAMNRLRPGHASRRDVIRELIEALRGMGITLYLYTHPADGHDLSSEDQMKTGWTGPAPYATWNAFINEVYEELTIRYGRDIGGFIFDSTWPEQVDRMRLRKTILSRKPEAALVAVYNECCDCCDFCSKEIRYPDDIIWFNEFPPIERFNENTWPSYRRLVAMVQGGEWWAVNGIALYTPEIMFRYTVLQAATATEGAGVTWAAGPFPGGTWETNVKESFQKLNTYIAPVTEAIKNTYPSTSFITKEGSKIPTLAWGGVATKSADDQFEYIHVLTPPTGKSLHLPPPADGKKFSCAQLLPHNRPVGLVQEAGGITLTLPSTESWNSINTVIKLKRS